MSDNKSSFDWVPFIVLFLVAALILYPSLSGGCVPAGWQIGAGPFNFKVKPLPVEKPLVAPETRCLVLSATWCGPCGKLKRNIAGMSRNGWRVGPLPTDDIEILDVDGPDPRIRQYNARVLPTLVIIDKAGKEIARKSEVMSGDDLATWIRSTRK